MLFKNICRSGEIEWFNFSSPFQYRVINKEECWSLFQTMMLSTLFLPRGGVMTPQVCSVILNDTGLRSSCISRDSKEHPVHPRTSWYRGVIQAPSSTPTSLFSEEEARCVGISCRRRLRDSVTLSLLSTAVTHRVVHKVLINWRPHSQRLSMAMLGPNKNTRRPGHHMLVCSNSNSEPLSYLDGCQCQT